jgi:hypothetical protein
MSSSGDCLQRADDAKQRAAQATDPLIKSAYERMAEYWILLARLDSLLHDEKITKTLSKAVNVCSPNKSF